MTAGVGSQWLAPAARSVASAPSTHLAATATSSASAPCAPAGTKPSPPATFAHVIWIFDENLSASNIIGSAQAPYFNGIANQCGLATNWHNISHDSLTNYVGALSGQLVGPLLLTQGRDCGPRRCPQTQANLFQQVQAAGGTWKTYAESMPTNCSTAVTPLYLPKHAPVPYFTDVASTCATNDVPLSNNVNGGPTVTAGNLLTDLTNNTFPSFAFIAPNLCDDGHTAGGACPSGNRVAAADRWLAAWLPAILGSPVYSSGSTAVFITWDEGTGRDAHRAERCWNAPHATVASYPSCSVAMLVVSPYTPPTVSATWFNHYNLLATTEAMLGLATLPTSVTTGGVPTPNNALTAFNL